MICNFKLSTYKNISVNIEIEKLLAGQGFKISDLLLFMLKITLTKQKWDPAKKFILIWTPIYLWVGSPTQNFSLSILMGPI